ncbi:hypothetical protein IPL85_01405 [Candidatus Saccharibacteria bacterium]|nr:MAG: hypothetical protein IPL85_01405 [Candidatus Saccharibacteria bacterium]
MANSITRQLLLDEASKRGWRVEIIGMKARLCRITTDTGKTEIFSGSRPLRSSANGRLISVFKDLTLEFVESLGYSVPAYATIDTLEDAERFMSKYERVVVKPIDGSQSKGVSVGITSIDRLIEAVGTAKEFSPSGRAIAQNQIEGKLYRIFVLNGTVPVVTERRAAQVIGDGVSTIEQLVVRLNADPRRGDGSDTPLKKVKGPAVERYLGGEALSRVPLEHETVRISDIESVSAGGEAANVTEKVNQAWIDTACHITSQMGLFVAGFDIICADITKPPEGNYVPLLEINSSPGFKIHEYPSEGLPVHLAPLMFDNLL